MTIEEKYNKLVARLKRWADLTRTEKELEAFATCSHKLLGAPGNEASDAQMIEEASHALECRTLLKSVGELGEGEVQ